MIIPSDQNWYKEFLVAQTLRDTLKGLKMKYPGLRKMSKHRHHYTSIHKTNRL